jgi:branched-chain amino acid transport system ATP-binding protein
MEGRHCFEHLTVEENLLTGAYTRKDGKGAIEGSRDGLHLFPAPEGAAPSQAGYTSGGEQQMTAIGRALMSGPRRSCWTSRRWAWRRSWWSRSSTS